jgi:hypothetical protein
MRVSSRPHSPIPPNQNNTGGQYFDRRGEVTELKQALRAGLAERNQERMRENVKKVIMYMTLGIDMSRLFSEMVMASQLGDTVQKKMIYYQVELFIIILWCYLSDILKSVSNTVSSVSFSNFSTTLN